MIRTEVLTLLRNEVLTFTGFSKLMTYTDNADLNKKNESWKQFYNFNRSHGACNVNQILRSTNYIHE